jgi:hypothetical protein
MITSRLSNFVEAKVCSENCGWKAPLFVDPRIDMVTMMRPCCPVCGSPIINVIGQWKLRIKRSLFGGERIVEYVEFIARK